VNSAALLYSVFQGVRHVTEKRRGWQIAQSLANGKPILVVGAPKTRLFGHPCGDVAIDINPGISYCPNIEKGDIREIPYPDKSFGVAFVSHVLEHLETVEDAEKAIAELHRVAENVVVIQPHIDSIANWLSPEHHLVVEPGGISVNGSFRIRPMRRRGIMAQQRMKGDGKEWGFTVCDKDGTLVRGPEAVGHHYGVDVPVQCPRGAKPAAIFHTHPYPPGLPEPSAADIQAAQRFRIPYLCIGQPESGKITCHRVPRSR